MKQRITGLDLQVITSELNASILNYRLQNIYNVASSARQFLLKFAVPDSKKVVVLDCGNRVHLTEYDRATTEAPSNFVTKLRKHLKTRRLSLLKQIGNDRVLVFEFSDGLFYLVLEFFSAGNILLLDHENKILSLQRMVNDKGDNDRYAVGETYNMFNRGLFEQDFEYKKRTYTAEEIKQWIADHKTKLAEKEPSKKNKVFSIHKALFVNASHLSSDLIQKNLHEYGIVPSTSCLTFESDDASLETIIKALDKSEDNYIELLSNKEQGLNGVIVAKHNPSYQPPKEGEVKDAVDLEYVYDEFHPFKPYKESPEKYRFIEVSGYNQTLDKFFSTIESTKFALKIEQQKQNAANRLEYAKQERDKQIQSLVAQQELNSKKGDAIILSADLVSSCMDMVQKLIDQQMDWTNIESYLKLEQTRGNSIAQAIRLPLNLKENKISVILPDTDYEKSDDGDDSDSSSSDSSSSESESESDSDSDSDSDSETKRKPVKKVKAKKPSKPVFNCWIDLSLSPYANAALYFDSKKSAETKQEKVGKNTELALKNAERKIKQDLAKNLKSENETLKQIRPKYWFEKFYWFVSNEGYLCLAGRDNSQIDMIYYRHFSDNDYYVSSDIEGSLKVFIKNPFKGERVPPSTLFQAGMFALSASNAWNSKITTSAWYLPGDQISKKDFDGSLISPGEFNVKGKKEYMPPLPLVMGFGFYALGDEETTNKYREKRIKRQEEHGLKVVMDTKKKDLEDIARKQEKEKSPTPEGRQSSPKPSQPKIKTDEPEGEEPAKPVKEPVTEPVKELSSEPSTEEDKKEVIENGGMPNKKVRGKKAKMKKIATKYADQDEEERRMRMDVLGTLKQVEEAKKQKQIELENEAAKQRQKYQETASAQKKKKQDEREYQKYIMEEKNEDESSMTNYIDILDSFIAKPQVGDHISGMVAVFAPWGSLNKFKYKVKVQPGNNKKGKSVNEAVHYFTTRALDASCTDTEADWPVEREYIKSAKPNDLIAALTVGKLKLSFGSGFNDKSKGKKRG